MLPLAARPSLRQVRSGGPTATASVNAGEGIGRN
jgi:hypothetical protein